MKYLSLFEDFIFESKSDVPLQWSKDFERILTEMEHPLAYELFKNRFKPEPITFLDTTMDGDFISYLPADKVIKQLESNDFDRLVQLMKTRFYGESPIYKEGNILTRTGRVFRKLFPSATPQEIEKLTNEFKSKFGQKTWKFLEGFDIVAGYQSKNYSFESRSSTLMNSCMNDQTDLIEYYQNLPVRLLVLENEKGLIIGRALIWKIEQGYLMDRVYTIHDKDYYLFTNYAKNEGWWWKSENKSSNEIPYTNGRETKWFPISIKAPIDSYKNEETDVYSGFPYMDTFWFGYDNHISNHGPKEGGYILLTDTDGFPESVGESILDVHGEVVDNPDDYVYSNTQGGLISMFNAIWVSYSKPNGSNFGDYLESNYLKRRVNGFTQDNEGNWFRLQDCKFLEDGSIEYPEKIS